MHNLMDLIATGRESGEEEETDEGDRIEEGEDREDGEGKEERRRDPEWTVPKLPSPMM